MALRRHIELGACVTHRATQVFQVRRCGTPTPRDIATSGSYYGVTGPIRAS
ncbi:hypothetical protein DPMN_003853 [Dreissena polymorpha]|uniref:Uncharacterized protein n=1 Tax=Dreissena polymorpha TaxID=45954 RepID=A0A9D4MRI2_DREPO|nr:hypothetical protein DPMN_003853 [Dreissena polymorpha]